MLTAFVLHSSVIAAEPNAAAAFESLQRLAGQWQGETKEGRTLKVSLRPTAGGSVLVETWTLAPGRESLTLYHLDGDQLLATHYCPQGNQPRLRLRSVDAQGRMDFVFKDGSNTDKHGGWHQHAMWIRVGEEGFTRSETYVENGSTAEAIAAVEEGEAVRFRHVLADTKR